MLFDKKSQSDGTETEQNPLMEAFLHELKDIYWAEKKLTKALPEMSAAAQSPELKEAIDLHLKETKEQVKRVEQVFRLIQQEPKAVKCDGMTGIVKEGEKVVAEFKDSPALDAVIIGAAQKVEHYEIAAYGTLRSYASLLGLEDAVALLQQTIDEEGEADKKLTLIAESLANPEAEYPANKEEQL